MENNFKKRKQIRLKDYDYATAGAYFLTVCTNNRRNLFGEIVDGEMQLNDAGELIESWWNKLSEKFINVDLDECIIMPNHLHGIIIINYAVGADPRVRPKKDGIPEMIQWFKTMSTNEYIRGIKSGNWQPFHQRLWQRNYYEHVIRNEKSLNEIREYIYNNPMAWETDHENPNAKLINNNTGQTHGSAPTRNTQFCDINFTNTNSDNTNN